MRYCKQCRQYKQEAEFYLFSNGFHSQFCKECTRFNRRESYRKNHPIENTVVQEQTKGIWLRKRGGHTSILWTGDMLSLLKRYYPTTRNDELVELLGVSKSSIERKARQLNLSKDKAWVKSICKENSFLAHLSKAKKKKQDK